MLDAEVARVQRRPHLGADQLTHLAGVLAAEREAAAQRIRIRGLEREVVGESVGVGEDVVVALEYDEIARRRAASDRRVDASPSDVDLRERPVDQALRLEP